MLELRQSNDVLGNRSATEARWAEDGYLFFRKVLPLDALMLVKHRYMEALQRMGVVAPGAEEPIWNGESLENFPTKVPELYQSKVWRELVANPDVTSFFSTVLGETAAFVPILYYRVSPPTNLASTPHQDGFYNEGLDFRICWIPLMDIDEETGGLAIAPGLHTGDYLHDPNDAPRFRIPAEAIPAWRRSDYEVGDALIFHFKTPHMGLPNASDRFRLSIDVRFLAESDPQPVLGILSEVDESYVVVRNQSDGSSVRLSLDDQSYIRDLTKDPIERSRIRSAFHTGDEVLIKQVDGTVRVMRALTL